MLKTIDLNSDMGELGGDVELMPFISSCNISCGAHAGTPELIEETVRVALEYGLNVGAHPSYPDRKNFGRYPMPLTAEALHNSLNQQLMWLKGVVESLGGTLHHVKPHGALYSHVSTNRDAADLFLRTVKDLDPHLKIYGMANSPLGDWVEQNGITFVHEVFADRRYQDLRMLRSRQYDDALIHDDDGVLEQVRRFVFEQSVQAIDGDVHPVITQSICLHSDTPRAKELARIIHNFLVENNVSIGFAS